MRFANLTKHTKLLIGILCGFVLIVFIFYIAAVDPKFGKAAEPEVYSNVVNNITQTTATLSGDIESTGGTPLTVRGFEYGTTNSYGSIVSDTNSDAYSFAYSWGSQGSGNSQFSNLNGPEGIAKDSNGNVYVVDGGNNRIQKFSATGSYISQFGSAGQGNGQFNYPHGISIDSQDNIFIADSSNHRIQKFNSAGVYQSQFGGPVFFGGGSGQGQLKNPNDVAVDLDGNVFVTDSGNNRVQKFTSSGDFVSVIGSGGSGDGQFIGLRGIDTDVQGNIYVVDASNNRIQKLNNNGVFLKKWGSYGSGDGQFSVAAGITLDNLGYVYVVDGHNHRVQKFTTDGVYVTQFGSLGTGNSNLWYPISIFTDNVGGVFVSDVGNKKVKKFTPTMSTGTFSMPISGLTCGTQYFFRPFSINASETGYGSEFPFTTAACGTPTTQTISSTTVTENSATLNGQVTGLGSSDIVSRGFEYGTDTNFTSNSEDLSNLSYEYRSHFGTLGDTSSELNVSKGLTTDSSGNIYVADTGNHRIKKYTNSGTHVMSIGWDVIPGGGTGLEVCTTSCKTGVSGSGDGQLNQPEGLAVDDSGNIYVADRQNNRIQVFDSNGAFKYKFGTAGTGSTNLATPAKVTLDELRNIYVADTGNHRIKKYTNSGTHVMSIGWDVIPGGGTGLEVCTTSCKTGVSGSGDGQLDSPQGIKVDTNGVIHVADTNNNRVQKYNPNGSFLLKFGTLGNGDSNLVYPQDIAINPLGNIYVTDYTDGGLNQNNRIQIFNSDGNRINQVGDSGSGNGQFSNPSGIAVDESGNILASDSQSRIQKFSFLTTVNLSGLAPDTVYYYRAYAVNSSGTAVGSIGLFTTLVTPAAPSLFTSSATSLGQSSATLNGNVTRIGTSEITERGFEYGTTTSYGTTTTDPELITGAYNLSLTNLLCGTTYHYRAYASNSVGTTNGSDQVFTTLDCPIPPSVTTSPASSTTLNSTILNGNVSSVGSSAISDRGFEYGLTTDYGTTTDDETSETGNFSYNLSSLSCGTTYHFRAYATSSAGATVGSDQTFVTTICPTVPTLTSLSASSIGLTSAVLNGNVSDTGNAVLSARGFEYGTTTSYGTTTNDETSETGNFSYNLSSLSCGTTYHFRAYATNTVGTSSGANQTFTTSVCPTPPAVTTTQASGITTTGATFNGSVSSIGTSPLTARGFKYGLSAGSYPGITDDSTSSTGSFSSSLNLLNCGTKYHFVAYATNNVGSVQGADQSFTTSACPVVTTNAAPTIITELTTTEVSLVEPGTISFIIVAEDDDKINKVELFNGTNSIDAMTQTSVTGRYTYKLEDVKAGTYSFTAKVTDNGSPALSRTSLPVTLVVTLPPEQDDPVPAASTTENINNNDQKIFTPVSIRDNIPDPFVGAVESVFRLADRVISPIPIPAAKALPYTTIGVLGAFASVNTFQAFGQAQSRLLILGLARRSKETEDRRKTYIDLTSHYLNTPITTMQSSIELLESLKVVPQKTIEPIKKLIKQLADHAKSLLTMSDNLTVESKATSVEINEASKQRLLTSVGFMVPVIGVFIVAIILNLLFVWSKKYDSSLINTLVQTGLYVLGVIGLAASFLLLKRNKISASSAEKELKLEKDFTESQTKFISESGNLLYKDVQKLEKYIPDIQDAPHGNTFVSGFDAFKKAVLKITYLNKLTNNEHMVKVNSHEIESIAKDILDKYQPIALQNLVNLKASIEPNLTAKIDPEALRQLLTSTLDNAIKFTNQGGDINLTIKKLKTGKISITVDDTGKGIPKDKIDHLFVPFSRATDTRKFDYAGLGLDLYMDKLVVDQVNGKISIKSKEGAGTKVTITLNS